MGRARGWVAEGFAGAAVLGLAQCCYATSVALHGNGFIAAFTGGLAFAAAGGQAARLVPFVAETGTVAVALAGARLGRAAVLFVGWCGPRGLASAVFGLLALEDVAGSAAKPAVTVIAFTWLLSVLTHGLSAGPLAKRYGPRLTPPPEAAGPAGLAEIPERRLIRRSPAVSPHGIPRRG